jgi:2-oxoglutarate ferredoxin oxidoreductase subunit beta
VTFADHEGSTKSYAAVKEHDAPLHDIEYVPYFEDIKVEYEPGTTREVTMPDGSSIVLKKLGEDYDPSDAMRAMQVLHDSRRELKLVTGLVYYNRESRPFTDELELGDTPLAALPMEAVRPPKAVLEGIMRQYREGRVEAAGGGG